MCRECRTAQLADSGLSDYKATAHGFVTFLAQLGEGFRDPPQVVRADELAVEVYWRAPNRSKQRVIGRRFDVVKPTDIAYHRDHLAVVQNNFPAIIRLGEGDEVRDVPHPLSLAGRDAYDFAIADSLRIAVAGRAWDVVTVEFRPKDDRQPRAVGAVFLDRETATVVRLSIGFTRAALLDPALEDVSVVLDNGLVEGRFWLPRRQEIEIRRAGTWLDFPARGIIRGTWDICCVEVNRATPPAFFNGPEITFAPPAELAAYPFSGRIADSIPALARSAFGGHAAEIVQARAAELVGAGALRRATRWQLAGRSVSDFAHVNRVEGLALGGRVLTPLGAAFGGAVGADLAAHYGLDDRLVKYDAALAWNGRALRLGIAAFDAYRDIGPVPEASGLANSIAAQELGSDATDEYRAAGVRAFVVAGQGVRWRLAVERARETPLALHAVPFAGAFRPAAPADPVATTSVRVVADARADVAGLTGSWRAEGRVAVPDASPGAGTRSPFTNGAAAANLARPAGAGDLTVALLVAGSAGASVPVQALSYLGGPVTAPGYAVHSLSGRVATSIRADWAAPVTGFTLPLGRFGAPRVDVKAVPFAAAAWTS
ncbi:MAG: hypothetical protein U9Q74_06730, partial [Gemmatimonadota bacterium]|nr:hypothetical protein [Gemmatimonadota bacterium]